MNDTGTTIQEFFGHLGNWDATGASELFADSFDWFVPGSKELSWAGKRNSPSEVVDFFETMWSKFHTEQSKSAIDAIVLSGEDAVVIGSFTHVVKSTGKTFFNPFAMHLRVSGGKITRVHLYEDTLAVAQAFNVA